MQHKHMVCGGSLLDSCRIHTIVLRNTDIGPLCLNRQGREWVAILPTNWLKQLHHIVAIFCDHVIILDGNVDIDHCNSVSVGFVEPDIELYHCRGRNGEEGREEEWRGEREGEGRREEEWREEGWRRGEESGGKRKRWDERGEEMAGQITKEEGGVSITFLRPYQSSLCSLYPWEHYHLGTEELL